MTPMMNLAMKRTMAKNMLARKKGNMVGRQEFHSTPKEEREEERAEERAEPERHSVKRGIEKMRRNGGSSY